MFVAGDNIHLKILVPSIAAGAIIGKGGETIAQVQKEAGARVKMSKANDFYPGKTEAEDEPRVGGTRPWSQTGPSVTFVASLPEIGERGAIHDFIDTVRPATHEN